MTALSVQRLYVILESTNEVRTEALDASFVSLLPHLSLTANIYAVAPGLSDGISFVERIQKRLKAFLKTHRFVRYNLHFLHALPQGGATGDAEYFFQYYYQPWKRGSLEYDREGYIHQEIPRLTLFALIAPSALEQGPFLASLVGMLDDHFILPSLYLQEETAALANEKDVASKVKKIYYGKGASLAAREIAFHTCSQDLIEASCAALASGAFSPAASCGPALFLSTQDGRVYPCMNAFSKGYAVANAYEETQPAAMISRCHGARETEQDCRACRKQALERFVSLALPGDLKEKVEALRENL